MLHSSSESTHIIWSMLFVATALVVVYMLAFDKFSVFWWLGEVDEVAAEQIRGNERIWQQIVIDSWVESGTVDQIIVSASIASLSESIQSAPQEVTSLSEVLVEQSQIWQGSQAEFTAPEPMRIGDKQFFSVQQLFSDSWEKSEMIQQWVLALANTYQWQNNWRFVLPQDVWLGEEVEYILKDQWNTHYVYLGNVTPMVFDVVEQSWWTVVAIEDKVSINRSWFFWDRLWIVTHPSYVARNKIIALVQFVNEEDTRLLQIDRDWFDEQWRDSLRESFAEYYTW